MPGSHAEASSRPWAMQPTTHCLDDAVSVPGVHYLKPLIAKIDFPEHIGGLDNTSTLGLCVSPEFSTQTEIQGQVKFGFGGMV